MRIILRIYVTHYGIQSTFTSTLPSEPFQLLRKMSRKEVISISQERNQVRKMKDLLKVKRQGLNFQIKTWLPTLDKSFNL